MTHSLIVNALLFTIIYLINNKVNAIPQYDVHPAEFVVYYPRGFEVSIPGNVMAHISLSNCLTHMFHN